MSRTLGKLTLNRFSKILKIGYFDFSSRYGIDGLAKESGRNHCRVDVLAVVSKNPGNGRLREFISALKDEYSIIGIWHVDNDKLRAALERYGFTSCLEKQNGEMIDGMKWEKHQ